jgi:hypothetical protein
MINDKLLEDLMNKTLKETYCENLDEYFKKVKMIVKDESYINKLSLG